MKKVNKRGFIIAKDEIIEFDDNFDHTYNIKDAVINKLKYYHYQEDINDINVVTGPAIVCNENNILAINCFDNQFQIYVPYVLEELSDYQRNEFSEFLKRDDITISFIKAYPRLEDMESEDINYTKEEVEYAINENKGYRK